MTALFKYLLLSCFATVLFAQMTILKPQGLRDWWDKNTQDAHTSIASFGQIPWGKKILGSLELANPPDACDYIRTSDQDSIAEPILIAVRGNCPFYLKAHYAQLAGAQMLVIVDNQYEEVESKLMVDSSGQGESIHIPSVLLSKRAGDKLIDSLKSDDEKISNVQVVFDFLLPKNEKVEYNLWVSSSSSQTFRFLRDWKFYADKLADVTAMQPHFLHFKMFGPSTAQDATNDHNCICGGKYCCTDPDGDLPNSGKDVLYENLRQLCILREYNTEVWWHYIQNYDEVCLNGGSMQTCSVKTMSKINIDSDHILNCVNTSFIGESDPATCTVNRLLDAEEEFINKDGAFIFPSVFINKFMYRGNLVPGKGLFEAICESFNTMPGVCEDHFDPPPVPVYTTIPIEAKHWPTVLATGAFLVVFGFFVFCCYKRHLKKEMYRQMVRDVNIAVSQYIAFKDDDVPRAEEA